MKKFVFLYYGYQTPTPEAVDAWNNWFASIGDKMLDSGSPFGQGREISHAGTKELSPGMRSLTGYSIIHAENLDEAEKLLEGCPMVTSVRIYEAVSI